MNSLLLTLPFCAKDAALLKTSLAWMAELQPEGYSHPCLMVADFTVPQEQKQELLDIAKSMFTHAETMIVRIPAKQQVWPLAANAMFAAAARQVAEGYKLPWFWFEPDAVALRQGWLDDFADAYAACPKRFMGALIPAQNQPELPPVHLAGCSVYDPMAYVGMKQFTETPRAFDIAAAPYTVPRAANTPLLQHFWGKPDLAPTFRVTKGENDPENTIPMGWLKPETAVFHRCKDGTLIDLLRARKNSQAVPVSENLIDVPLDEPAKRPPVRSRKSPAQTDPATITT